MAITYFVWLSAIYVLVVYPAPSWTHTPAAILVLLVWLPLWCYQNRGKPAYYKAEMFANLAVSIAFLIALGGTCSLEDWIKSTAQDRIGKHLLDPRHIDKINIGAECVSFSLAMCAYDICKKAQKTVAFKFEQLFSTY